MERPVFVVGTMRSGTTLVRLVLDSHPRLAITDESGFLRAVAATKSIEGQHGGEHWYRRYGVSDEEMDARLRAFYDDIFSGYARARGKSRWGDKTPFHIHRLPLLCSVFPDAQVVGVVRHPGAVVASQLRRGRAFGTALDDWRTGNARLLRSLARPQVRERVAVVRYEDVVAAPEPTLRALLGYLDEEWSPSLLRHHEVQRSAGAGPVAEGGTRTTRPIDARRVAAWAGELDEGRRRRLLRETAALREVFGYDEEGAGPPLPERLLRGPELLDRARATGATDGLGGPRAGRAGRAGRSLRGGETPLQALAHLARMARTDPRYTLTRLPVVLRSRLRGE